MYAVVVTGGKQYRVMKGETLRVELLEAEAGSEVKFDNVVNFASPLEQTAQEASGYYLLAYQAPHPRGRSGFQPVKVTVSNPEFRVKARSGYRYGDGD